MIANDRLELLITYASALAEANKTGLPYVALIADPAEALGALLELKASRTPADLPKDM